MITGCKLFSICFTFFIIFGCSNPEQEVKQTPADTTVAESAIDSEFLEHEVIECGCVDEIDENTVIDTSEVLHAKKTR
jgi:hypothetical protein